MLPMATSDEWGRRFTNGAGIVLSILLAFAIDAAWDARGDRLRRDSLLDGLRQEFAENLRSLDGMVAEFQRRDSLLLHYFEAPAPETEAEAEQVVPEFALALLWWDKFDPSMASLEMILARSEESLLFRSDLVSLLWTWKRQYEDTQDDEDAIDPHLIRGRDLLGELGARGVREDLRPSWKEQVERIRSSQELSALAQSVLYDREMYRTELQTLRETTARVLEALGRE